MRTEKTKEYQICLLLLTCVDSKEADCISTILLEKKLIVCVKRFPVSSSFLWKGKIEKTNEVLLIMDSKEENFERVEKEVAKIHSYDSFVLISTPVTHTTDKVKDWMKEELVK
ncbi:hypothetical protein A2Y99_01430 [Candidatus Gottesmanbacteria bacterium RBG_13_37_7]|uniref:Divalent-cation tolerance protein CutA n=1 Tax=Candidatus Gottesmanbacteria bacterium RBG_13_37_7 TaxID=1798369 RepID=A0A1F5YIH1_9BACT|nr:MAG: hypothetical protein A2Y99_01430 [Candidatus Gottesmanbacteria bacterium RBG_13_37_7]